MKLFSKNKTLHWKVTSFMAELRLIGVILPILSCLCIGGFLLESHYNLSVWQCVCYSFLIGLPFTLATLPVWFVYPTERPSSWQRFCRRYTIRLAKIFSVFATKNGDSVQQRDIRNFQYFLSHPNQKENMLADQIDTASFDWQDPGQWPL